MNENVLLYGFKDIDKYCEYKEVKVLINPNKFAYEITLDGEYQCLLNANGRQDDKKVKVADLAPISLMVLAR